MSEILTTEKVSREEWSVTDAEDTYRINDWGDGYFKIDPEGHVVVRPRGEPDEGPSIRLSEVVEGLEERGIRMPVLLRFGDIIDSQIRGFNESFAEAMEAYKYRGGYRGVFPIKVNQNEQVLDEIVRCGDPYRYGLEAGSKAEMTAALAYMRPNGSLLICNGYKDEKFIELGLYARRMGIDCVFVIETPIEVPLIIRVARRLGIDPKIGIRVRLSSCGSGHWKESTGDRSVFGLNIAQVMHTVEQLREAGFLHCLRLLHYHLGSQIPDIRDIRVSLTEACRVYAGLVEEGAPMGILDIGGGLAIDYDGSHSDSSMSRNYGIREYCLDVVEIIKQVMDSTGVEHPELVTEAGRAAVAHCSVLLFNILDVNRFETKVDIQSIPKDSHAMVRNLVEVRTSLTEENLQECYNDAVYYRDEVRNLFKAGALSLKDRARAEQIFWDVLSKIYQMVKGEEEIPESMEGLESSLADIYYGNFSIFQSLPDTWAIDQIFPVMPIQRLDEKPSGRAVLSDITCDCDGKIDQFIDSSGIRRTLPVHELREDESYVLAVFLVGAYQETLGDLHNLLGGTNVVSIRIAEDGSFEFEKELGGESVAEVLSYVEYDPKMVAKRFRDLAESAVRKGTITVRERRDITQSYDNALRGYTYFES